MDAMFKHYRRLAEQRINDDERAVAACMAAHLANRLEDQTKIAVAAAMLKLGERTLTITPSDIATLHGRRVLVEPTDEGLQIKIV